MSKYLINDVNISGLRKMITLLDYELDISDVLKSINLSGSEGEVILIDTALVAGMDEYRFIEGRVNEKGYLELKEYKYVDIGGDVLKVANSILRNHPDRLNHSILTISQKKKIETTLD